MNRSGNVNSRTGYGSLNGENNSSRRDLLHKIQALHFAKLECELFLNTHPESRQALEHHRGVSEALEDARAEYAAKYGPITTSDVTGDKWTWAHGAWPWHMERED